MSILPKRILLQVLPLLLAAAMRSRTLAWVSNRRRQESAAPKNPPAEAPPAAEEKPQNADAKAEAAEKTAPPQAEPEKLDSPEPIPPAELVPNLKTITVRRDRPQLQYSDGQHGPPAP